MEINVVKSCKSRLFFDETTCFYWSEMGDSNSRQLAPKASALPTALIPDMKFRPYYRLHSDRLKLPDEICIPDAPNPCVFKGG